MRCSKVIASSRGSRLDFWLRFVPSNFIEIQYKEERKEENAQLEMESIRLQCRCEMQIVDCTCKISRQRIVLLHFPHHNVNGLACRPIPCLLFHKIQAHMSGVTWSIQHIFFFADIDFPTKFKVMSQTQCSKSKTLQVWESRFIPLFVTTTIVS